MRLPDDVIREVFPWEEFIARALARRQRRARGRVRRRSVRRPPRTRAPTRPCTRHEHRRVRRRGAEEGARAAPGRRRRRRRSLPPTATAADAAVVFTADARRRRSALHDGTLDLSVAFMRGQVKMAGDFGVLLHVLPVLSRAAAALTFSGPDSARAARPLELAAARGSRSASRPPARRARGTTGRW